MEREEQPPTSIAPSEHLVMPESKSDTTEIADIDEQRIGGAEAEFDSEMVKSMLSPQALRHLDSLSMAGTTTQQLVSLSAYFNLRKDVFAQFQSPIAEERPDQVAATLHKVLQRMPLVQQLELLIDTASAFSTVRDDGIIALVLYVWIQRYSSESLGSGLGKAVWLFYAERKELVTGDNLEPLIKAGRGAVEVAALHTAVDSVQKGTKVDEVIDLRCWQSFQQSFIESFDIDARSRANQRLLRSLAASKLLSGAPNIDDVVKCATMVRAIVGLTANFTIYGQLDIPPWSQTWLHLGFFFEVISKFFAQDVTEAQRSRFTGNGEGFDTTSFSELAKTCYDQITGNNCWKPPSHGISFRIESRVDGLYTFYRLIVEDINGARAAVGKHGILGLQQISGTMPRPACGRHYMIEKPRVSEYSTRSASKKRRQN